MCLRRAILVSSLLFAILLTCASTRAACIGPGENFGGANHGWNVAPCSGAGSVGGGGGNIGAGLAGAAAAVQAVGLAAGILGDVLDRMPKATLEMPSFSVPSVSLPSVSLPSPPPLSMPSAAPAPRVRQSTQPQDDRAASCARLARIYKTSHVKMVAATQYLEGVNDNHPDRLCEFGRGVGLPLLQENVN